MLWFKEKLKVFNCECRHGRQFPVIDSLKHMRGIDVVQFTDIAHLCVNLTLQPNIIVLDFSCLKLLDDKEKVRLRRVLRKVDYDLNILLVIDKEDIRLSREIFKDIVVDLIIHDDHWENKLERAIDHMVHINKPYHEAELAKYSM